jgi:hypothetical protein
MPKAWPALLALGLAARLAVWWFTIGSNDVVGWANHARNVDGLGLALTYRHAPLYNHPPLAGLYAAFAWHAGGGDLDAFARWIKLPGLAGELLAMALLGRLGGMRLAALYALLPAPILVSSYHGNTDCLYAAFTLAAAIAWDRQRPALAGLAMAAALNVKLIPLVLLPLFVVAAPSWRALFAFTAAASLGVLPYLGPALGAGDAMYRNMVAYNSSADEWGLLAILNDAERSSAVQHLATPVRDTFLVLGRYLVMGAVLALAAGSRLRLRLSMCEQAALAASLFLLLAPGFGVQYVAFPAPLLLAVDAAAGVFWGVASGLFIGALYAGYLVPGPEWYSSFRAPFPGWSPELGLVAWTGLAVWTCHRIAVAWRAAAARAPAGLPAPAELASRGPPRAARAGGGDAARRRR